MIAVQAQVTEPSLPSKLRLGRALVYALGALIGMMGVGLLLVLGVVSNEIFSSNTSILNADGEDVSTFENASALAFAVLAFLGPAAGMFFVAIQVLFRFGKQAIRYLSIYLLGLLGVTCLGFIMLHTASAGVTSVALSLVGWLAIAIVLMLAGAFLLPRVELVLRQIAGLSDACDEPK